MNPSTPSRPLDATVRIALVAAFGACVPLPMSESSTFLERVQTEAQRNMLLESLARIPLLWMVALVGCGLLAGLVHRRWFWKIPVALGASAAVLDLVRAWVVPVQFGTLAEISAFWWVPVLVALAALAWEFATCRENVVRLSLGSLLALLVVAFPAAWAFKQIAHSPQVVVSRNLSNHYTDDLAITLGWKGGSKRLLDADFRKDPSFAYASEVFDAAGDSVRFDMALEASDDSLRQHLSAPLSRDVVTAFETGRVCAAFHPLFLPESTVSLGDPWLDGDTLLICSFEMPRTPRLVWRTVYPGNALSAGLPVDSTEAVESP